MRKLWALGAVLIALAAGPASAARFVFDVTVLQASVFPDFASPKPSTFQVTWTFDAASTLTNVYDDGVFSQVSLSSHGGARPTGSPYTADLLARSHQPDLAPNGGFDASTVRTQGPGGLTTRANISMSVGAGTGAVFVDEDRYEYRSYAMVLGGGFESYEPPHLDVLTLATLDAAGIDLLLRNSGRFLFIEEGYVDNYSLSLGRIGFSPIARIEGLATYNAQASALANAVPEPATWGLMILGFGAVGSVLRQRRLAATPRAA